MRFEPSATELEGAFGKTMKGCGAPTRPLARLAEIHEFVVE